MKTPFKLIYVLIITLFLAVSGCSNDDDNPVAINLQDLEVTIDENPTNGQVIGTVQSDSSNSLTYSITSQTPDGAFSIDESSGELTVANEILFDFETNPIITAVVSATETVNTATVTITINNVTELNTQDFTVTVDENPTDGNALGTVQATGDGQLSFSITSQVPAGAISIDANTGELTVADAVLFDFETNPVITANILVDNSGSTETVVATINLDDVDTITSFLSTSQANYNAASHGDWIAITETEYDMLANNLNAITRVGTTTAEYNNPTSSVLNTLNGSHTLSNKTTTALIPNNGYIIAFKYKMGNTSTNVTEFKVKQSITANNSGFSDLGSVLPSHSGAHQNVFFVLKGNNSPVTNNGYLGFFDASSSVSLFGNSSPNGAYWGSSDTSNLNGTLNRNILYQGLSTTQIQW